LLCIILAYAVTSIFTCNLQTGIAESQVEETFTTTMTDVVTDVKTKSDSAILGVAEKVKREYVTDNNVDLNSLLKGVDIHEDNYEICEINIVDKDGYIINKINGPTFDSLNGEEAFSKLCFEDILIDSPCLYMMKKELFEKNPNLRFTKNLYHEDFELMPLVLVHAKSVISTDIYGYYYVQSDGSIMRTKDIEKNIKKANDKLLHYDNMLKNIEFLKDKTKEDIKKYYTNTIILTVEELQGEERKKYIKQIKKRKMLKNIKAKNLKQLIKKVVLNININWYLKLR
jgi:hypothetical protein